MQNSEVTSVSLHKLNQIAASGRMRLGPGYLMESLKMKKKKVVSQYDFPPGSASVVIVEEAGRVLAVSRKNNHGDLGLPGGKIEPGETPTTAACRESLEETGNIICNAMLAGAATINDIVVFIFRAELIRDVQAHVNEENALVKWATPAEICSGTFGKFNEKYVLPLLSKQENI